MKPQFALTTLLAFAAFAPAENAAAQNALGGAILGGTAGAIVGGAVGGGRGAAVGAIVGATTGAAIASQGQPRPGGYYYYDRGCYVQRPTVRGSWSRRAIADSAIYRETRDVPDRPPISRASRSHRAAISASILVT